MQNRDSRNASSHVKPLIRKKDRIHFLAEYLRRIRSNAAHFFFANPKRESGEVEKLLRIFKALTRMSRRPRALASIDSRNHCHMQIDPSDMVAATS